MNDSIRETLYDLTKLLHANDIQHALVGGLAASIRGRIRVTEDVDLVLDCDVDEAIALLKNLDPEKFVPFVADAESIVRQCFILPLEDSHSKIKADLAIGMSGFEKMIVDRATSVEIGGNLVRIATAEDLLLMKVLAGRPQDEQDIKGILEANAGTLDWDYCIEISKQLQAAMGMDLVDRFTTMEKSTRLA